MTTDFPILTFEHCISLGVIAFTEVVNKEEEPVDPRGHKNVGLVHFRHWGLNQRGETVFEGERRVLVKKRAFVAEGLDQPEKTNSAQVTRSGRSSGQKHVVMANAKTRVAKRARTKTRITTRPKPSPAQPRPK